MLETLPDTFIEVDAKGLVQAHIGGGRGDTVLRPDTLDGKQLRDCWPEAVATDFVRQVRKTLANRQPHTFNLTLDDPAIRYEARLFVRGRNRVLAVLRRLESSDTPTFVDTLTGLATCDRFLIELERVLEQERLRERHLALVYVDIDRFSRINESLGRKAGDDVLREIAARMQKCFRDSGQLIQLSPSDQSNRLARVARDEFVLLLAGITSRDEARQVARRVRESFAAPINSKHFSLGVEPRIGIALFPHDGDDAEALFNNARAAVRQAQDYAAKTGIFYSDALLALAQGQADSAQELRWAMERGQFELHYLPRVRLADRAVTGLEALLRWRHPVRGLLAADQVVPLAETVGLMNKISYWILQQCCQFAGQLDTTIATRPVVSTNLTEAELALPDLPARIGATLDAAGLTGDRLQLEFTEAALMRHQQAPATLRQLKAMGLHLVLDNLGTGHVSLSELSTLPIDGVKIDQKITQKIDTDITSRRLCAGIIALGRELGLAVVAEGIETDAQYAFLREHDCDAGQGFLFSQPLPPDAVGNFLATCAVDSTEPAVG